MNDGKKIWLVSTDHLEDALWFREEEDFKIGMNYVAVLAAFSAVTILAFILMSNHVHFILYGTKEDVLAFINGFKTRHAQYLRHKYGLREALRRNGVDIREVPEDDEALERAVAYVQMNCVAANICSHPIQYPWGSGSAFFDASLRKGVPLSTISVRMKRKMLHSKAEFPGHWLVSDEGYILPSSYLNVRYVESLFRTPQRMDYFLRTSSKARKRIESSDSGLPSFRDQILLAALPDLCRSMFGKAEWNDLSEAEQSEMLRQLRFRFSSNVNQLARVAGLSYEAAARLLDAV